MALSPPRRLARLWAGALLTLLAAGLIAPSPARAGCSYHITSSATLDGPSLFELLPTAGDSAKATLPSPGDEPPSPCSGSLCSQAPLQPSAPAPSAPVRVEPWGSLIALPALVGPELVASLYEAALFRPIRLGTSIFHPPRLAPSAIG
jgi:hypothetical protein